MPVAKHWTIDIFVREELGDDATVTHAEALLHTPDATDLRGYGQARRHPDDAGLPVISDELATARALSDLAHQLLQTAAADIDAVTSRRPLVTQRD
jgi:hypothetical protein